MRCWRAARHERGVTAPVSSIRNLGPAVEAACARAYIHSAEALRALGAHEAYRRMLLSGTQAHFIGYYVMHMALQGRPWNDCRGDEKAALRRRFDRIKNAAVPEPISGLESALDEIGIRLGK